MEVVETIQVLITGSSDEITEQLRPYVTAGAERLTCRIGALDLTTRLDQLEPLTTLREQLSDREKTAHLSV